MTMGSDKMRKPKSARRRIVLTEISEHRADQERAGTGRCRPSVARIVLSCESARRPFVGRPTDASDSVAAEFTQVLDWANQRLAPTGSDSHTGARHSELARQMANDTLAAMGMATAFGAEADFSGMADGGGLWLDCVEHEAFIEVDEEGTRAAAATGGGMLGSHGPTVTINQPYLYAIRDRGAGTVLFLGRVTDPTIAP